MKWLFICVFIPFVAYSQSNIQQAIQLFDAQNYSESQVLLLKEYKKNPNSELVLKYLGEVAGANQEWEKAEGYFNKLKELHPSTAEYHYKSGGALAMQVQDMNMFYATYYVSDLIDSFERAIGYNPNYIEPRWALIEIYIQVPKFIGGSERKAQEYADELIIISLVDSYLSKGHIAEHYKRYNQAEVFFKKAVEISGGSKNSYKRLISLYEKMKAEDKKALVSELYNTKFPK